MKTLAMKSMSRRDPLSHKQVSLTQHLLSFIICIPFNWIIIISHLRSSKEKIKIRMVCCLGSPTMIWKEKSKIHEQFDLESEKAKAGESGYRNSR